MTSYSSYILHLLPILSAGHHDVAVIARAELDGVLEPEIFGKWKLKDCIAIRSL